MSGFHVDPAGLDGLYNVLHRAGGDTDDVLRYATRHCDLTFEQQGLIANLAGPHQTAYKLMTEALERLRSHSKGAASQVNLAQGAYAKSDTTAAARLDRSIPGARDPALLRTTLATGRPDLGTARAPFADVAEPTARLASPNYTSAVEMWSINPLTDLVSPTAWLRQVSVWLFGHDPFEGWAKQFSGDWQSYIHCAAAWRIIGDAVHDIGRNLVATAADVGTVWQGNAAEAEQEFQVRLGAVALSLHHACDQYSVLYTKAAEATKELFAVVSGLIVNLIDVLLIINLATVVGTATIKTGVGAVAGYSVAAYYAWQAHELYSRIASLYANTEATLKALASSIAMIQAGLAVGSLPELPPYRRPGHLG